MNISFFNEYHLGDNIHHLTFLRKLCALTADNFVYYVNPNYLPELKLHIIGFENRITLKDIAERTPTAINAWIGEIYYQHPKKHEYDAFYIEWFNYLTKKIYGKECNLTMVSDYHLYNRPTTKYDILIVNSVPASGQFDPNLDKLNDIIRHLSFRYRVITTKKVEGIDCTLNWSMPIVDIGTIAANCEHIIALDTGPHSGCINQKAIKAVKTWIVAHNTNTFSFATHSAKSMTELIDVITKVHLQKEKTSMSVKNFTVIESEHGKFIVNRNCSYQAEALIKTGRTHIEPELEKIFTIVDTLPEGTTIIDGGANIGFVTIPVSNRVKDKDIRIVSFEPQRQLFYALAGSIALNDITNVFPQNVALGKEPGFAEFPEVDYSAITDFGAVSIKSQSNTATNTINEPNKVPVVTIDSLSLNVSFIKLDVEGYEINALLGATNTIKTCRPWIWAEYNNWCDPHQYNEIKDCLVKQGVVNYSFFIMDNQNMLCAPTEKIATAPALAPLLRQPF